ncbi:MAG: hypothetical protein AAF629_10325 [Chloroflexota bacterium]
MAKTLIFIHGRSWKPPKNALQKLWFDAVEYGLKRDHADVLGRFKAVKKSFVYFGDLSNDFLHEKTGDPIPDDTASRQATLEALKKWKPNQFTKRNYNNLPGKESLKEGIADTLGPILRFFRLSDDLVSVVAPDMGEYWKGEDSFFGSAVREPLVKPLKDAFDRDDSVCIIAHSLGSMISYDTLWKFSYRGEYRPDYNKKKVDLFITLGSPLGDATVQAGLFGSKASGARRFPANIRKWVNVAAEDDFISHDSKIAGDYKDMKRHKLIEDIVDQHIYNLALRDGKSNPHHSCGYLIHPKVSTLIADWLKT